MFGALKYNILRVDALEEQLVQRDAQIALLTTQLTDLAARVTALEQPP